MRGVLAEMGIHKPSPIQQACIPATLSGSDVLGAAETGSGKTAAFALPIVASLAQDPFGMAALVVTPTRELAFQIAEQFRVFGKPVGLRVTVVVGGVDQLSQTQELATQPHVIVGTPGRLAEQLKSSSSPFTLDRLQWLVLDEADRLLEPTYGPALSVLLQGAPESRQTLLYSATLTDTLRSVAAASEASGKSVFVWEVDRPFGSLVGGDVGDNADTGGEDGGKGSGSSTSAYSTVATLSQKYVFIPESVKDLYLVYILSRHSWLPPDNRRAAMKIAASTPLATLLEMKKKNPDELEAAVMGAMESGLLEEEMDSQTSQAVEARRRAQSQLAIIFVGKASMAAYLMVLLREVGFSVTALHSGLTQRQRLGSLDRFRGGRNQVLVATDVAARGLDIPAVGMVINFDLPLDPRDYVHRVGRTARAGRSGSAISLVSPGKDVYRVQAVEKSLGRKLETWELDEQAVLPWMRRVTTAKSVARTRMSDWEHEAVANSQTRATRGLVAAPKVKLADIALTGLGASSGIRKKSKKGKKPRQAGLGKN